MRFFCADCGRDLMNLETPGEDNNRDLICPECANKVWSQIRIRMLEQVLQEHFQRIP